jgi:hypothetical protein
MTLLREAIVSPRTLSAIGIATAPQPAEAFHPMKQRVQRAWADLIAVTAEFEDHPLSVERLLARVVKDVHLPKAQQDFTLERFHGYNDSRY